MHFSSIKQKVNLLFSEMPTIKEKKMNLKLNSTNLDLSVSL